MQADKDEWQALLPALIQDTAQRWSLTLGKPFTDGQTGSWVAPCSGVDGQQLVIKLGFPHYEATNEIAGLQHWHGNHCVRLVNYNAPNNAMLLERCVPGNPLSERPEPEQDQVLAMLLPQLWITPPAHSPVRPLTEMIHYWCEQSRSQAHQWPDSGLATAGLDRLGQLAQPTSNPVLLATDLHAGNVLQAQREPWLVIDPKPFTGDRCYDATQHLLNCSERLAKDAKGTVQRFADLLAVDGERVTHWLFGRLAALPFGDMQKNQALARLLVG